MGGEVLQEEGWVLREATSTDIAALMDWFPNERDVVVWGGPKFRYPFNRASFFEDVYWGRMLSYGLVNAEGELVAFGQLYDRNKFIHLARLIVAPPHRGQGNGRRLIELLMKQGRKVMAHDRFSLFVFRDNTPAYECYKALGFEVREYPENMPHADECYFLTRSD